MFMKVLVTAGNTQAPIDQVRCITNIFSGKTGARLALEAYRRGADVTLLTSRPDVLRDLEAPDLKPSRWRLKHYQTFEEMHNAMRAESRHGGYDVLLHSAAVSDYLVSGVLADGRPIDMSQGKIKSSHPELILRLVPAPKLVDLVRESWGFQGVLVKFKLEVGTSMDELQRIAEASRLQSRANLMVANTLEGMHEWALVGAVNYQRVSRGELPRVVLDNVAALLTR
jgi:phosphopantothenate-cysteine ligase/phosphopantothenoylcysteine decarboxylase/phosphopantothenate--cysteine ligase